MASHSPSQRVDGGRPRGQRNAITRVRTGCMTCRKRRKKCDERRPGCINCEKTNIYCEGYAQAVFWEARTALRRRSNGKSPPGPTGPDVQSPRIPTVGAVLDHEPFEGYLNHSPEGQPPPFYYPDTSVGNIDIDHNFNFLFDSFGVPGVSIRGDLVSDLGQVHDANQTWPRDTTSDSGGGRYPPWQTLPSEFQKRATLPQELPFPIAGVDTPVHRRLFCHFTSVMTSILTTFAGDCNPFNTVVIPLALGDQTVMNTILSLAGSHLLRVQNRTDPEIELATERARLHDSVIQTQSSRMRSMTEPGPESSEYTLSHESMLATSLLLCVYEICEGSGNDAWRGHLDMARQAINMASTATSSPTTESSTVKTKLNPFLLEFFIYHDSLATVTVPSASNAKPLFDNLNGLPFQNTSLVGVQDGLINFIERISNLRSQAKASKSHHPDGNIIVKAVLIWSDLNAWQPNPSWTKPRQLITTFYQWSLFIWLYSIMYPEQKSDSKVQETVRTITASMYDMHPRDGVMACLLFPLFIMATAAIAPADRETVCAHFARLRAWSGLGNVDLTFTVVQKMWRDHDAQVPGSWDWVKKLQEHNLSFVVT